MAISYKLDGTPYFSNGNVTSEPVGLMEKLKLDIQLMYGSLQNSTYYAGIGTRDITASVERAIHQISQFLHDKAWYCRHGCADGSDKAFGQYARSRQQRFIPWDGFNHVRIGEMPHVYLPTPEAFEIAKEFHPNWKNLSSPIKALMARNVHQILGPTVVARTAYSKLVICYTRDGADGTNIKTSRATGGTGQAIRIAAAYKIPVINIAKYIPDPNQSILM